MTAIPSREHRAAPHAALLEIHRLAKIVARHSGFGMPTGLHGRSALEQRPQFTFPRADDAQRMPEAARRAYDAAQIDYRICSGPLVLAWHGTATGWRVVHRPDESPALRQHRMLVDLVVHTVAREIPAPPGLGWVSRGHADKPGGGRTYRFTRNDTGPLRGTVWLCERFLPQQGSTAPWCQPGLEWRVWRDGETPADGVSFATLTEAEDHVAHM